METAGGGQKAEIRTEPDEHLRQCIPYPRISIFGIALTSLFGQWVRVMDIGVRFVVIVLGQVVLYFLILGVVPDPQVAQPGYVAAPAALLAFVAWQCGDGALANVALDRALADDPRYSMAQLLRQVISAGAPPSLARLPMTPEEVAASYDDIEDEVIEDDDVEDEAEYDDVENYLTENYDHGPDADVHHPDPLAGQ